MSFKNKLGISTIFVFPLVWFYIDLYREFEEMKPFAANVKERINSMEAKSVNSMVGTNFTMFWFAEGAGMPMNYGMAGGGRGSFYPWNILGPESKDVPSPERMILITAKNGRKIWLRIL
jgi:hypothetical protein